MQRPASITAVAWVIIALAAEAIVGSLSSLVRNNLLVQFADPRIGVPLTAQIGSLVQIAVIISAAFMLRGANWARISYVVLTGVTLLGVVVIFSRTSTFGPFAAWAAVKSAALLYVLFRPEANAYFRGLVDTGGAASAVPNGSADA